MGIPKDEEIKVRVPSSIKKAIKELADARFSSESEIARQAMLEYIARYRSGAASLAETPTMYKARRAPRCPK